MGFELYITFLQGCIIGKEVLRSFIADEHAHQFSVLLLGEVIGYLEADRSIIVEHHMGVAILGHIDRCADEVMPLCFELVYFRIGQRLIFHAGYSLGE